VALLRSLVEPAGRPATRPALDVSRPPGAGERRVDVTTVADDEIVLHVAQGSGPAEAVRLTDLAPGTEYEVEGRTVRTLERPPGELLCRFATVNDVHFGETVCGRIGDFGDLMSFLASAGVDGPEAEAAAERARGAFEQLGESPVLTAADLPPEAVGGAGDPPSYPWLMSTAAAEEIALVEPVVVLAKGDLTGEGRRDEYEAFLACYGAAFGERLVHVRGNHDAMSGEDLATGPRSVEVPGATLALLDTVIPGHDRGRLPADQLDWLDALAAGAAGAAGDRPVLVFGHHHAWNPSSKTRSATYFGINPDDSEALVDLVARRPRIAGYFAGHTHRNRVRRFAATGDVPYVEVAAAKDFPGSWAEYRVFEGGVLQIHRRISTPGALAWSERCRALFWGLYPGYAFGGLADRCFGMGRRVS
jgi:Icc protein